MGNNCNLPMTKIGSFCSIADNVRVIVGNHPTSEFVSTSPVFFSTKNQSGYTFTKKNLFNEFVFANEEMKYLVDIGHDVWIGQGVSILSGVKIGTGAIIGTNALVTKNVPPFAIVGGVPAKLIRYRFTQNDIGLILNSKWWENEHSWFENNYLDFSDVRKFIKTIDIKAGL
ncbi:antibiotic acetyltransferase [Shewanella frigidimarina]|nr:antibiotic acetyltransferase [Shewanella frigidimarina]